MYVGIYFSEDLIGIKELKTRTSGARNLATTRGQIFSKAKYLTLLSLQWI
jgi:hypothetical protein